MPRTGRRAPRRRKISECGALQSGATGDCDNKNDGVSLTPRRRPGDNSILQQQIRVNGGLRAREVRVHPRLDQRATRSDELSEAIKRAQAWVSTWWKWPRPPTPLFAKVVDFGKFRYDISKQEKDKKASEPNLKEIKFRVNIDDHDYLTKIRHGEQFLDRGNKVRVQLQFRGREMAHRNLGCRLMHKCATTWRPWRR
jgi:translation initiation factor IF-3